MKDQDGFPILNPRDMLSCFTQLIERLDPEAEYVLVITDPRDRRNMSIEVSMSDEIKPDVLRNLVLGFWPPDEDLSPPMIIDGSQESDG